MSIFLITFTLILLVVMAMAVGVMFGRKPLQGSCGGLNNIAGMNDCEICGGKPSKCSEFSKDQG